MSDREQQSVQTLGPQVLHAVTRHLETTVGAGLAARTNTWLLNYVLEPGDVIGAPGAETRASERLIVGFIDDHPLANWEHPCRYVLYRAGDGTPKSIVDARMPPKLRNFSKIHIPVSTPLKSGAAGGTEFASLEFASLKLTPQGERYAIIFAGGVPNPWHLHDAELCWRLLVNAYGFAPDKIKVLNYDGTLDVDDGFFHIGPDGNKQWPGDNSHFRMNITGPGTQQGFQAACKDIGNRIQPEDLLFLFIGNHGGHEAGGSFLIVPDNTPTRWGKYFAQDFATDLKTVPKHRGLITVMQQCSAGGFVTPILNSTTATKASVAASCKEKGLSHHCGDWDPFAVNWILANWGISCPYAPYPGSPVTSADTDGDHSISSQEAFDYCAARNKAGPPIRSCFGPDEKPFLGESSPGAAAQLSLDQQFALTGAWHAILMSVAHAYREKYAPDFDDTILMARMQAVAPELQRLLLPEIGRLGQSGIREPGQHIVQAALLLIRAVTEPS